MLFKSTNIEERLGRTKSDQVLEDKLINEVNEMLSSTSTTGEKILEKLAAPSATVINNFNFDLLDTSRIYHIDQIKEICISYRLRFLDSKYFKGVIPHTAIEEIERLEKVHNSKLEGFKIMAPSKLFKLEDKDDPLLFAPIGKEYYYLVHKWGNDLHPFRKALVWPFRNIMNLSLLVVLISLLTTSLVPSGLFSKNEGLAEFMIVFFFMFKSIAAVVIFYGFALGKNFNPAIWKSKYFNA
ncbi:hypothetical protein [Eudoraea chungangensis]|uniref:hypothetical protein n=1 Tax=Eudoraea chungangensis TaxID=1481905 RepID=UPI0023EE0E2D|nr:hypothetical protein [Eudoraea chungangensis]